MKGMRILLAGIISSLLLIYVLSSLARPRLASGQVYPYATPVSTAEAPADGDNAQVPDLTSGHDTSRAIDVRATASEPFRIEDCPELCDYPDIHEGRVVYEDHRGPGIEVYGTDLNTNQEFMVIHDGPHQHFPVIYNDIVVYTDLRHSTQGLDGTDVFALDLSTGQEVTVTTAPGQQINLALGPRYIVWEDDRDGATGTNQGSNRDIYAYDMETDQSFALATGPATQLHPDIDGDRVVWSEDGNIVGYDLGTDSAFVVSAHPANQLRPAIYGDLVVWEDWRNGNWDIYGYRFSTGEESPISVAPYDQNFVDISEDLIVWQDYRHGNWDVYVYDIETQEAFPVSRNARKQKWPAVDGTTVVWSDFLELEPHIYGFLYDGTIPAGVDFEIEENPTGLIVGAFPGGAIELTWQDNTDAETHYVVERHTGMLGTDYETIATVPANVEAYSDTDTQIDMVYWYRVYAANDQGRSATSNESYNVALPAVPYPSEQERYMQVLINEVRADPAKFGYPAYAAQPPVVYNPNLNYAARAHATASVHPGGSGGHVDWADRGPGDRAVASGFEHVFVSENMGGYGTPLADSVERSNRGFLDSHGHRDNMLVAGRVETGLGFYFLPGLGSMWVETFAGDDNLTIPALPSGAVSPFRGRAGEIYTYTVNFYNANGYGPDSAQVVINGVAHDMLLDTGGPGNGTYRFSTTLQAGENHVYYFAFDTPDGSARLPQSGVFSGPRVFSADAYDLELSSISLPASTVWVGDAVDATIWLYHSGTIMLEDVLLRLYLDHPHLGGAAVAESRVDIPIGFTPVTVPWTPQAAGAYQLYAVVDDGDAFVELHEWNNARRTPVTILDSTLFDESSWLPLISR